MKILCGNLKPEIGAWFENHQLRTTFGRPSIDGKRVWKLDLMIKKLENKGILSSTAYDKNKGLTKYYSYLLFSYELQNNELALVKENVSEKYYNFLINTKEKVLIQYLNIIF